MALEAAPLRPLLGWCWLGVGTHVSLLAGVSLGARGWAAVLRSPQIFLQGNQLTPLSSLKLTYFQTLAERGWWLWHRSHGGGGLGGGGPVRQKEEDAQAGIWVMLRVLLAQPGGTDLPTLPPMASLLQTEQWGHLSPSHPPAH